jgi:LuxR family transcriptional regulator, maltose regulon positive regulatory protein
MTRSYLRRWPIPRAKTAIPQLPATFVARAGVRRRLERLVTEFPVTLVCAPAGYGKTLLLADWIQATGEADKIWVSLDADDNNTDRFWTTVLSAIRAHAATAGVDVPTRADTQGGADTPAFLAEVVDALAGLPAPSYLVLDDVHEIHGEETLHGIATLIQHQPDNLRLVLSTRADPPLPLARLRLQARLAELRMNELRVSREDTAELLRLAGVALNDDQVRRLSEQTDGWAAGLRLAARSLREVADHDAFLTEFATNDRAVADFLVSEVLTRLPARTREFLQVVSVCDEVTPVLAAALSGYEDAGAILAALERESSLVMGIGADRQWFRMHPLLRSYLRADLTRQHPDRAAGLHATAARWFADQTQPGKAFDHAARTGEPATSVALLRRYAVPLLMTGEHRTVRRALTAAETEVSRDPWLTLVCALTHLEIHEFAEAGADLRQSREIWPSNPEDDLVSLHRLVAATYELTRGVPATPESTDWPDLVRVLADGDLEGWARLGLGWTLLRAGERRAAELELGIAARLAREHGFDYISAQSLTALGVLSALDGAYDTMESACAESLTIADVHGWRAAPGLAVNHALTGLAQLLRLEPEASLERTQRAAAVVSQPVTEPTLRQLRYLIDLVTGAARFDIGSRVDGLALMRQARRDVDGVDLPVELLVGGALLEYRGALVLGREVLAKDIANWTRANAGAVAEVALMRAWTSFACDDIVAAESAVREVLDQSPAPRGTTQLEARLLETAIEIRHGHRTRARGALTSALTLAEPSTLIRPFHQADPSVRQLLREQIGGFGGSDDFAARLSRALSTVDGHADVLTYRERAVLALLSSPQSLDEVASDLTVSVNTVKTHVRAIYAKLGVNNRRAAVVAGRRLGLT